MMWDEQRQRLLALREETVSRLENTGRYGLDDAFADELSELSVYDNHPGDVATELFERGKDVALRASDERQLQHIETALQAIEEGTYGVCRWCGEPIPKARLEAYPTAMQCVRCKEEDERRHPDRMRPIEEEYLWPGFARVDTDETSNVVFDGEDSWQAVARYNERPQYESDQTYSYGDGNMDDNEGIVDEMDAISNEQYRRDRLS